MLTPTMRVKTKTRRTRQTRALARYVRVLRARMPELRERYGVKSLGVFGSYVRGQQKPRSDLDVLVEYADLFRATPRPNLKKDLTAWLGVKVDLVPLHLLKPFIGKNVHAEVIWLLRDGQATDAKIPRHRANGKRNGKMANPKREYLDYLNDILANMEMAEKFVIGFSSWREVYDDLRTALALTKAIENIGEAVKKVPLTLKNDYPQVAWAELANLRNKLAHEYFDIDYEKLWLLVTEDIPRDKVAVKQMIDQELAKRAAQEAEEEKKQE